MPASLSSQQSKKQLKSIVNYEYSVHYQMLSVGVLLMHNNAQPYTGLLLILKPQNINFKVLLSGTFQSVL